MSQPYGSETLNPDVIRKILEDHLILDQLVLNSFTATQKSPPYAGIELKWSVGGVESSILQTIEFRILSDSGMDRIVLPSGTQSVLPGETTTYRLMAYRGKAQREMGSLVVEPDFTYVATREIRGIDAVIVRWMDERAKSRSSPELHRTSTVSLTSDQAYLRMYFEKSQSIGNQERWVRWYVHSKFNFKPAGETLAPQFFENNVEFQIHPFSFSDPPALDWILEIREELKSRVVSDLTDLSHLLVQFVPVNRRLVSARIVPETHSLHLKHMLEFQVVIPELKEEAVGAHN